MVFPWPALFLSRLLNIHFTDTAASTATGSTEPAIAVRWFQLTLLAVAYS